MLYQSFMAGLVKRWGFAKGVSTAMSLGTLTGDGDIDGAAASRSIPPALMPDREPVQKLAAGRPLGQVVVHEGDEAGVMGRL